MDVVMTNPPFGSEIPITDPNILRNFDLAHIWERTEDGGFRNTGPPQGSVAPEVLFIERCVDWLKPGGRMGIVLPDGILGNPGDEYIRWWILRHTWVLASIDLPVEVFIVEANVNILTSLLFLKKKTEQELKASDLGRAPRTTQCSWPSPRRSASIVAATRSTSAAPTARRSSS
jgi:type I restriction enzyme M protein